MYPDNKPDLDDEFPTFEDDVKQFGSSSSSSHRTNLIVNYLPSNINEEELEVRLLILI